MAESNCERDVFWKSWYFEIKGVKIKRAWLNQILREMYFENLDIFGRTWHFGMDMHGMC